MNPTASSLDRAYHCPASEALPRVHTTSGYADEGTEGHAFVRRVLGGMAREVALAKAPSDMRPRLAAIDFAKVVGDLSNVRAEVAYALNVRTDEVRELGVNIGRAYPDLGPDWVCGSLDIEGERMDGVPVVPDLKFGYAEVVAEDNLQLGFFGRVRSIVTGAGEADVRILRIRQNGTVHMDPHTLDTFELDDVGDKLVEIVDGVARARAGQARSVSPGPWCRYCPAFEACPAKTALARSMLPDLRAVEDRVAAMTLEERGRAYEIAHNEIKPLLERVLKALKESAVREPLPLSNGKFAALSSYVREGFDQAKAVALMKQLHATDAQVASCYTETLVESVREMKRPKGRRAA